MSSQPPAHSTTSGGSRAPHITCREVLDFVMAYLDDELSAEQRQEFERHLGVCPSCVNYLDTYKTTILLGKDALCAPDAPALDSIPEALVRAVREARLKGS